MSNLYANRCPMCKRYATPGQTCRVCAGIPSPPRKRYHPSDAEFIDLLRAVLGLRPMPGGYFIGSAKNHDKPYRRAKRKHQYRFASTREGTGI